MYLTLVVPSYNEEENVARFYEEVTRVFEGKVSDYEFVFVDDGSRDKTYAELCGLNAAHDNVRVLSFSRNFGKESAIYAGLEASRGDLVCLIDADLQQRPEVVLEMLSEIEADAELDCVTAYQKKRKENKLLSGLKSCFYKFITRISEVDFVNGASDFRLMKRTMVEAILAMSEHHRFSKGIFSYVGFNTKYIPYEVQKREHGQTKWSLPKLVRYATDGIISFSTAPLKLSTFIGFLSSFSAIVYLIVVIIQKLAFGINVPGYATLVVLLLLIGGIQLFCLGILGSYIAKMHIEVKKRPIYILRRELDSKKEKKD
ncbi:MAG: glycosyltransferase family 2 protein [Clostridia bacterium]|nr:glycosyltransferase family 2 protein [Clostridia bacterium]